jgi:putative transposase
VTRTIPDGGCSAKRDSRGISLGGNAGAPAGRAKENAARQRRYWERLIRDEEDFARHVDYIHFNPVKHGQVIRAADWPYSSIHRYIEAGMMVHDWGGGICGNDESVYGERG